MSTGGGSTAEGVRDHGASDHGATETAVVVLVPEAEPVVGAHRSRLDRAAAWGVPAHLTVLYPFVDPDRLDAPALERLRTAVAGPAPFDLALTHVAWFGDDVAWLAPDPAAGARLRALTEAVAAAFPDHPPYDGVHDDVVPHLTLGEREVGGLKAVRRAADEVAPALPVRTRVEEVVVLAGAARPGSWSVVARLRLGR